MDTLFRKKPRPRQSQGGQDPAERSIPYDKLGQGSKAPVYVGTVSQGLRNSTASGVISAPMTNPTLTSDGTELNVYAMQKSRSERERLYPQTAKTSGRSPNASASSSSATLINGGASAAAAGPSSGRVRRSEASSTSMRSPDMSDFGHFSTVSSPPSSYNVSSSTIRPMSVTSSRSEGNRASKYAASLAGSESQSHYSQIFHHKQGSAQDEFYFPRPSDEEVEVFFEQVKLKRDLGDLRNLSTDQKWQIVYNDEQIRWKEERDREEQTKKVSDTGQATNSYPKDSPEWYLRKFLDQTITAKQAASLLVSLRTGTVRCVAVV